MTSSWLPTTNYYALTSGSRATGRRVKTAELIVQDIAWAGRARKPRRNDHDLVAFGSTGKRATCARQSSARVVSGGSDGACGNSPRTQSALWACTAGSSKNLPGQSGTRIYSGIWCYVPVDVCIYRYMVLGCAGSDSLLAMCHERSPRQQGRRVSSRGARIL